jgi:hypothetical protein
MSFVRGHWKAIVHRMVASFLKERLDPKRNGCSRFRLIESGLHIDWHDLGSTICVKLDHEADRILVSPGRVDDSEMKKNLQTISKEISKLHNMVVTKIDFNALRWTRSSSKSARL